MSIIAEVQLKDGQFLEVVEHQDKFDVVIGGKIVQPDHDSYGVIRYLCHVLQNSEYLLSKESQ